MMSFVADRELGHERANGIEDGIERIPIARENHPGSERTRAFLAEGVEALVYDDPRVGLARACPFDGIGDASVDGIGDRLGKFALEAGSRAEMVEEVRVRSSDLGGDGL